MNKFKKYLGYAICSFLCIFAGLGISSFISNLTKMNNTIILCFFTGMFGYLLYTRFNQIFMKEWTNYNETRQKKEKAKKENR